MKLIVLLSIFLTASAIGFFLAKTYQDRIYELKALRIAMNQLETKMKYTKEPIGQVFAELARKIENKNIQELFQKASDHMAYTTAENAWNEALHIVKTSLTSADIETLKAFGKMLGKTDLEGQVKEIKLTSILLEEQVEDAKIKKQKNGKMYQSLGVISGLALCIILV